jgi:DNA-binding NtrC family response regulator
MTGVEGTRRILIVDDEPEVTESLAAILTRHDYEVRVADAADKAMETVAGWRPDLALVDVVLPRMNGIELSIIIREMHPRCRLVLFSGQHTTRDLLEEAVKKGNLFEVLAKPVHPMFLLDYVASRLAGPPRRAA